MNDPMLILETVAAVKHAELCFGNDHDRECSLLTAVIKKIKQEGVLMKKYIVELQIKTIPLWQRAVFVLWPFHFEVKEKARSCVVEVMALNEDEAVVLGKKKWEKRKEKGRVSYAMAYQD